MIRKAIVLLAFVGTFGLSIGLVTSARAQEKDDWTKPITKQGSAALLFTINGLGSFNVGAPGLGPVPAAITGNFSESSPSDSMATLMGAAFKYFVSDDLAVRILLGFNHSSRKALDTSSFAPGQTLWGIGAGAEMHFRPLYSTSPYVGAQITLASSSTDEPTNKDITYSGSAFGVEAFAGFDWFFTRGLAVGAEGGLGWMSSSFTSTLKGKDTKGPVMSNIALATNGNVHVVVYF